MGVGSRGLWAAQERELIICKPNWLKNAHSTLSLGARALGCFFPICYVSGRQKIPGTWVRGHKYQPSRRLPHCREDAKPRHRPEHRLQSLEPWRDLESALVPVAPSGSEPGLTNNPMRDYSLGQGSLSRAPAGCASSSAVTRTFLPSFNTDFTLEEALCASDAQRVTTPDPAS